MFFVGIDIGSTASKVVLRNEEQILDMFVTPTGWSSKHTAEKIKNKLIENGISIESDETIIAATGYGRVSVDFADYIITEITCHGKGGQYIANGNCTIIDIGGQDTKVINVENKIVTDFLMNDKCSAGTGKFIEIMANRLGTDIDELFELAQKGKILPISSLCTVFAESEIINYIGEGRPREDIAAGVIDSVAGKVSQLCQRFQLNNNIIITGGLSHNEYFASQLSKKIKANINTCKIGRFAGAIGASLLAESKYKKSL